MSSTPARLLVVDDEAVQVTALVRTLGREGYQVSGAHSAQEALTALRASRFDILITDLQMPDMDGLALLHAAKTIDNDLVGIVMTGHGTIETAVEAMKGGALDYIVKPFNLTTILPVLSRALAVRRLRMDNAALLERVAERTAELESAVRELRETNGQLAGLVAAVSRRLHQPLLELVGLSNPWLREEASPLTPKHRERVEVLAQRIQELAHQASDLLRMGGGRQHRQS